MTIRALRRLRGALPLLAIGSIGLWTEGAAAGELSLRFLEVGHGDAILVTSAGHHALIDSGPTAHVVEQLARLGVRGLDLLVTTHNHADHMGGAEAVLRELGVLRYLDNELPTKAKVQENVLRLVAAGRVQYVSPHVGSFSLGEARLTVLPPALDDGNQNDASVGIIVERGTFRAMLPGDAEAPELKVWLDRGLVPRVDVLKAAHHGSRNGLTPQWLDRLQPRVVVISCGGDDDRGRPQAWALRYYQAGGRTVLRTDEAGAITVSVADDGSYTVRSERGPSARGVAGE